MQNLTVRALRHQTDELSELQLERADIRFAPGNCLALFNDARESRSYSSAAGTREDVLRFLIRRVPGGEVSCWLEKRKPGDQVRVSDPFGWFRPGQSEPGEETVFINIGTEYSAL